MSTRITVVLFSPEGLVRSLHLAIPSVCLHWAIRDVGARSGSYETEFMWSGATVGKEVPALFMKRVFAEYTVTWAAGCKAHTVLECPSDNTKHKLQQLWKPSFTNHPLREATLRMNGRSRSHDEIRSCGDIRKWPDQGDQYSTVADWEGSQFSMEDPLQASILTLIMASKFYCFKWLIVCLAKRPPLVMHIQSSKWKWGASSRSSLSPRQFPISTVTSSTCCLDPPKLGTGRSTKHFRDMGNAHRSSFNKMTKYRFDHCVSATSLDNAIKGTVRLPVAPKTLSQSLSPSWVILSQPVQELGSNAHHSVSGPDSDIYPDIPSVEAVEEPNRLPVAATKEAIRRRTS